LRADANDIASVIVLFHPKTEEVLRNIDIIARFTGHVFLVDNSVPERDDIRLAVSSFANVTYYSLGDNIGMAAALNVGANFAIERGYRYLLTMDQDSFPDELMIERMRSHIVTDFHFGILSPVYQLKDGNTVITSAGISEIPSVMTSGNILSLKAYNDSGPFCEKLFIDYVDHEYCLRLRRNGYRIFQVNDAILHHSWGVLKRHRFLWLDYSTSNYPPFRYYYLVRNVLYLFSTYVVRFPHFCIVQLALVIKMLLKSLLLESERRSKLNCIIRGFVDFIIGNYGKLL
jgi:rhamnosyltransferase